MLPDTHLSHPYRERSKIDFSILTNIRQKEGEDVGEFIAKFKGLFDRHSGMPKDQPGYYHLLNQLLMEAIRPHLKQAIILHLWKTKTFDELTALATYYDHSSAEPGPSGQPAHGQGKQGNAPQTHNTSRRSRRDYSNTTCWNCGNKGHTVYKCPQPIKQPFAFVHTQTQATQDTD